MGLFDFLKPKSKRSWYYTEDEIAACEQYLEQCHGKIESVFHEVLSPDVHIDVILIPPSEEMNCYKLVTTGMGAYSMNIPRELKGKVADRAELVIFLPSDWDVKSRDEKDYWPIRTLKSLARYPLHYNTWLGNGHTIVSSSGEAYAENNKLCGSLLLQALDSNWKPMKLKLSEGKEIQYLQVFPLYKEEMDFKVSHSAQELLNLFKKNGIDIVVDIRRKNACE